MQDIIGLLKNKIAVMMEDEIAIASEQDLTRSTIPQGDVPKATEPQQAINLQQKLHTKEIIMSLENVLKPLQDVDGYLASAIFDMSGEVLVKHNNSKYNVEVIGANAVAMINAAVKAVHGAGLGKCNFIQVNSELGIFGAVWAVEDESVAAVLLEAKANVGLAKLALAKVGLEANSKLR